MKIIITENQFKKLIENILIEQDNNGVLELLKKKALMDEWFYENIVKNVEEKIYPKYPDNIFYIDKNTNQALMVYNKKNGYFWVNYYEIWRYFESNYSHNEVEIKQLIKDLVGENYGLGDIIPMSTGRKLQFIK